MAFKMQRVGDDYIVVDPITQKTLEEIQRILPGVGVQDAGDGMNVRVGNEIKNAQWLLARLKEAQDLERLSGFDPAIWRQFASMPSDWVQGKINQHKHAVMRQNQKAEAAARAAQGDANDELATGTGIAAPRNVMEAGFGQQFDRQALDTGGAPPPPGDSGAQGAQGAPGDSGTPGDPLQTIRDLIDMGADPTLSIWEEMNRTGMVGNPFQDTMESFLRSQVPQFIGAGTMQSLRGQPVTGIGDYLSQSYGGGASPMSPEDLSMLISGQPGEGINTSQFAAAMDALDQEKNRSTAFNLAFGASDLSNAPLAIRNPAASQMNNMWQGYRSGISQEEIEDVKGQADFLRYAASKMGIG